MEQSPEDDERCSVGNILGNDLRACWSLSLGLRWRTHQEERQEGSLVAMSRKRLYERNKPLESAIPRVLSV
jgi:hypothetical protein